MQPPLVGSCHVLLFVERLSDSGALAASRWLHFVTHCAFIAGLLFCRRGRFTLPRKSPSPLKDVYCLLRRAALLLLLTVNACGGGGETDRDRENRVEGSVAQCQHKLSCCEEGSGILRNDVHL